MAAAGLASTTASADDAPDGGTSESTDAGTSSPDAGTADGGDAGEGEPQVCLCAVGVPGAPRRGSKAGR